MSTMNKYFELREFLVQALIGIEELASPDIDDGKMALQRLHDIRIVIEEIRQDMKDEEL